MTFSMFTDYLKFLMLGIFLIFTILSILHNCFKFEKSQGAISEDTSFFKYFIRFLFNPTSKQP
jgi:hypothetical protein